MSEPASFLDKWQRSIPFLSSAPGTLSLAHCPWHTALSGHFPRNPLAFSSILPSFHNHWRATILDRLQTHTPHVSARMPQRQRNVICLIVKAENERPAWVAKQRNTLEELIHDAGGISPPETCFETEAITPRQACVEIRRHSPQRSTFANPGAPLSQALSYWRHWTGHS